MIVNARPALSASSLQHASSALAWLQRVQHWLENTPSQREQGLTVAKVLDSRQWQTAVQVPAYLRR